MAKGGNVAAIVVDQPYQIGVTGARAVAMGLLKQATKPYYAVEALTVTKDTIKQGYEELQHREPPATVMGQGKDSPWTSSHPVAPSAPLGSGSIFRARSLKERGEGHAGPAQADQL